MSDETATSGTNTDAAKEQLVMEHFISLTYREELTPNLNRFLDGLLDGRLIGQRCPTCERVYVPGKGYCPLDLTEIDEQHELTVSDRGVVTGFTIITPVKYYGQQKTEPFVHASILLDGADNALGGQDITGIPHDEIRSGLRVRAMWKPTAERTVDGVTNRNWGGSTQGTISFFEPTGEPDAPLDEYREHMF